MRLPLLDVAAGLIVTLLPPADAPRWRIICRVYDMLTY